MRENRTSGLKRGRLPVHNRTGTSLLYPPGEHAGIVVIRSGDQAKATILDLVRQSTRALASESPHQHLWIVEDCRIRVRGPE